VKERQEMLAGAKREAQRIVEGARERQSELVRRHELTRRAELEAEEILDGARAREREIRLGAEDYADEILDTLEVNLPKFIAAIRRGRQRLQGPDEPASLG
jgi:cell division septum initiation protein DivIVA